MEACLNLRSFRALRTTAFAILFVRSLASVAEPIPVHLTQGSARGFLLVRSEEGKVIAHGELVQAAHGERIITHLTYRFLDGSIDEETATYVQRGTFHLISDHHIQKGPFFPKAIDYLVDVASSQVTSRSFDKDGKQKVEVQHLDLPPDVYNGLIGTILLNTPARSPAFKIGMVAPTGKGRLIKLAMTPDGHGTFYDVGLPHSATIFRVKVELGGVAGVVAPVVGKQPSDTLVWVLEGEVPMLVRQVGALYEGGPLVSIELAGTSFPRSAPAKP